MKDWRGSDILTGDIVVYPSRRSSGMWMNEGTVVEVSEQEMSRVYGRGSPWEKTHTWIEKKIKVKGKKHGKMVQPDPDRVTVLVSPNIFNVGGTL